MFTFLLTLALGAAPLTIEDYVVMPTLGSVEFSPDGRRIAYVVTRGDLDRSVYDSDVWLVDSDGGNAMQLTRGPRSDGAPRWSPDGKWIAFLSDRDGAASLYVINVSGGEAMKLSDDAIRAFDWSPDGKSIAFIALDPRSADEDRRAREQDDARVVGENARHGHLHLVDVESRKTTRLTEGRFTIWSFNWSPDGKTIVFDRAAGSTLDDMYNTDIALLDMETRGITALVSRPGLERNPRFSPDGKSVAFTSTRGEHNWLREHHLHVISISDRSIRDLGASYGRTPDVVMWSPDGRTLWFEGPMNMTTQLFRVDATGESFTNVTNANGLVGDPDVDFAGRRVAFVYQALDAPPELFISPLARFEPKRLTNHNAAFRNRLVGETRVVRWKNPKDGLEIEGLLTLPVGYERGKRYPLVTFVHGGPASRFDLGYLGYLGYIYPPHVFASRGFAMLRPNPRGTGGYGEKFRQANRSDWGGMDWIDINAGIDALIEQGIADPDRLGLMGWSYGGFIASWSISQTERFKAISIGAPLVDLLSFHGTTDIRDFIPAYFEGTPLEVLRARSPLWHLRKIDAPILIQHGEDDLRVPLSQGTMLYRALQELGNNVTMVIYPRTPHTPREPKLRVDVARRNVDFFEKHLGARASRPQSPRVSPGD